MSRPIIPVLISYLLGIVAGYYMSIPFPTAILLLLVSASLTAAAILIRKAPVIFFTCSMLTLSLLGLARMNLVLNPHLPGNHIANLISDEPLNLEGEISEPPYRSPDKTRLSIDLSNIYLDDTARAVTGMVQLTLGENNTDLRYGDRIRFLARVKRPSNFRNPGGFDYERYLAMKGIFATAFLKDAAGIIKTAERRSSFAAWIEGMRESIRETVFKDAGGPTPILLALLTGDQGEIPREIREAFSRTGTAHILAISGEHIGLISITSFAIFMWLFRRSERLMLSINIYKASALLTIPILVIYSLIAGSGPSITRAAIMGGMVLIAVLADRRRDIPSLIATGALLILFFEPQALFDISFQLSFASVISIAVILPYLKEVYIRDKEPAIIPEKRSRIWKWGMILLLTTVAASIGTAPLVAYYFNMVSFISPVSNIIVVPLIGFIIIPIGLIASILLPISPSLSESLFSLDGSILAPVIAINTSLSSLPFSSARIITPYPIEMVLFYLSLILFIYRKGFRSAKPLLIASLSLLLIWGSLTLLIPMLRKEMKVTFLDVGQGESTLIELPGGKRMLVDGGGLYASDFDIGERVIAPFLWHERIISVDYVVVSHPNMDHIGGLPFIIRNFEVKEIWEGRRGGETDIYREFMDAAAASEAVQRTVYAGDSFEISGVHFEILNPRRDNIPFEKGSNNDSIVLRITMGDDTLLFTGDIEVEAEERILSGGLPLKSKLIKAPHHGSLSSSSEEFMMAVRPDMALFSVGKKNRFGFPRKEVVERYERMGARIYRTDRDGAVVIRTDGRGLMVCRTAVGEVCD